MKADTLQTIIILLIFGAVVGGVGTGAVVLGGVLRPDDILVIPVFVGVSLAAIVVGLLVKTIRESSGSTPGETEEGGIASRYFRRSGLKQEGQLRPTTVYVVIGFLVALVIGLGVAFILPGRIIVPFVAFLAVWIVLVWLALRASRGEILTDLVIEDVRERRTNPNREVSISNTGDTPVDLRGAKIRDTEYNRFRPGIDIVLSPGQTEQFDIPPNFALDPSDQYVSMLGPFSIRRGAEAPMIVTQDGRQYALTWAEKADGQTD